MKIKQSITIILIALSQAAICSAQEKEKTLNGLVAEWMKLMQERQKIESKWQENKQILQVTKEGLVSEIEQFDEDIQDSKNRARRWSEELSEQTAKREKYNKTKDWLKTKLPELEKRAAALKPRFPRSILSGNPKLASALEAVEKRVVADPAEIKESLGNRVKQLAIILDEANKFSQTLKVIQEQRNHQGKDVLVTVIYLGFSQAYAANEGQTIALHGICEKDGWKFTEVNDQAETIWNAIEMAKGDADISFLKLPAKVK